MRKFAIAALAAISLAGCETISGWIEDKAPTPPETPEQIVFATKASFAAALALAVQYETLPRCAPEAAVAPCSDVESVKTLRLSFNAASASLDAAETVVRSDLSDGIKAEQVDVAKRAVDQVKNLLVELGVL